MLPTNVSVIYFQDPGHGWLRVKRQLLVDLGIATAITYFSYQRNDWVYLEEDCDANTFMETCKNRGITVDIKGRHANRESKIRSYQRYQN